jgi:hypothetical protein
LIITPICVNGKREVRTISIVLKYQYHTYLVLGLADASVSPSGLDTKNNIGHKNNLFEYK